MDNYERLMEKRNRLQLKSKDLEINMRLMYWKYIKQQELYKVNARQIRDINNKVKEVQQQTKKQIQSDMDDMNEIDNILQKQ